MKFQFNFDVTSLGDSPQSNIHGDIAADLSNNCHLWVIMRPITNIHLGSP